MEFIPSTKPKEYGRQRFNQRKSRPYKYSLATHPSVSPPPGQPPEKIKLRKIMMARVVMMLKPIIVRQCFLYNMSFSRLTCCIVEFTRLFTVL